MPNKMQRPGRWENALPFSRKSSSDGELSQTSTETPFDLCDSSDLPLLHWHAEIRQRKGSLKRGASKLGLAFIHTHSSTLRSPCDPHPLGWLCLNRPSGALHEPQGSHLRSPPLDLLGDVEQKTHSCGEACDRSSWPRGRCKRLTGHTRRAEPPGTPSTHQAGWAVGPPGSAPRARPASRKPTARATPTAPLLFLNSHSTHPAPLFPSLPPPSKAAIPPRPSPPTNNRRASASRPRRAPAGPGCQAAPATGTARPRTRTRTSAGNGTAGPTAGNVPARLPREEARHEAAPAHGRAGPGPGSLRRRPLPAEPAGHPPPEGIGVRGGEGGPAHPPPPWAPRWPPRRARRAACDGPDGGPASRRGERLRLPTAAATGPRSGPDFARDNFRGTAKTLSGGSGRWTVRGVATAPSPVLSPGPAPACYPPGGVNRQGFSRQTAGSKERGPERCREAATKRVLLVSQVKK